MVARELGAVAWGDGWRLCVKTWGAGAREGRTVRSHYVTLQATLPRLLGCLGMRMYLGG